MGWGGGWGCSTALTAVVEGVGWGGGWGCSTCT